jgi:hypothetical protein
MRRGGSKLTSHPNHTSMRDFTSAGIGRDPDPIPYRTGLRDTSGMRERILKIGTH